MATRIPLCSMLALALLASACGSEAASEADPTTTTTTTTEAPSDPPTTAAQADQPVETTTSTTAPPAPDPFPVIDADDIPDLVVAWSDGGDGGDGGSTLALARDIIGFPLDIAPVSDGGTASLQVEMRSSDTAEAWIWDWTYESVAADGIGEIDIYAENSGSGAQALRDHYDPLLADLGWAYSNSTGSDPSSGAGGPQSINHVYEHITGTLSFGPIDAEPNPLFIWADEDIDFRDGPDVPGYRVDVSFAIEPDVIPVPMLEVLVRELSLPDGARLTDLMMRSSDRAVDDFDAEYGLRYLDVELVFALLPNSAVDAQIYIRDSLFGTAYQPGSESFFSPGYVLVDDPIMFEDRWIQDVVVVDRYPGQITVQPDPETGDVTATITIRLEPNRPVLQHFSE